MFLNVHLFFTGCEKIQSRLNQITYKKMTGSDFASDGADTEPFFACCRQLFTAAD